MAFDKRKSLQNALAYTQQGKWDRAIAEYQAILKADPRDLTVCNNLGDLYARAGKPNDAIEQYLKLGDLYRADGLSVKAIAVYKKIGKLDPNRTEAYLACADLYQEQGLVGEAKVQLATVVEQYHKAGDTAKVVEIYQRLAQLDPANHTLLTRLADLLAKQGQREAAAAEYGRAAHAAQAAGQTVESKRLFQKARDMLPDSAEPNLGLAEFQLREGLYTEAVSALTKVTAADPANGRAWRLLGEAYGCLGQGAESIEALERAIALGVPEGEMGRPLSLALVQAGRTDEAIALCQRITEDALAREEPDAAVSLCQALVAAAPHLTALHAQLAGLLTRLGRAEEARAATWALAAAYEASGESEAAIHVYHQLLESDPSDTEAQSRLDVLEATPVAPAAPDHEDLTLVTEEPALLLEPATGVETSAPEVPELAPSTLEEEPEFLLETSAGEPLAPRESEETFSNLEAGSAATAETALPAEAPPEEPLEVGQAEGFGEIELPSIELPGQEESTGTMAVGMAADDVGAVDFLGEGIAGLGALEVEEGASGEVAEQLAEAEVYLKYGLADKARERLSEVVRLAPDNVVAHRKLKAIYLERNQVDEVCQEILAIARILEARLQREAALREIQEGLELAPDSPDLQGYLVGLQPGMGGAAAGAPAAPVPTEPPPIEELSLEIPDELEVVEEPSPQGTPADWGVTPPAPEGLATTEGEPALEVPLDVGAEAALPLEPAEAGAGVDGGTTLLSLGDEELPPELRALLEETDESPAMVVEGAEPDHEQVMADDSAEATFYLEQGMLDEARAVYERMQVLDPQHPAVISLGDRLGIPAAGLVPETREQPMRPAESAGALPPRSSPPGPVLPGEPSLDLEVETLGSPFAPQSETGEPLPQELSIEVEDAQAASGAAEGLGALQPESSSQELEAKFALGESGGRTPADGFVDLGAELQEELAADEQAAPSPGGGPLMDGLLKEFQKGVREHLDEKDFETHYNLGIAYKEMELYEEAVQEFRLAGRDPGRALACADLLGVCFQAMGQLDQAVLEYRAGLEIRGHPKEAYHALRYNLGSAYETQGDLVRALEQLELVPVEDPRFREVRAKVQSLRERVPRPAAAPRPSTPDPADAASTRTLEKNARTKKRISFI